MLSTRQLVELVGRMSESGCESHESPLLRMPTNFEYAQQQYPEFTKLLALVTELSELNFYLWEGVDWRHHGLISIEGKMAQAEEWTVACPEISSITFLDGVVLLRNNSDSVWKVFGR